VNHPGGWALRHCGIAPGPWHASITQRAQEVRKSHEGITTTDKATLWVMGAWGGRGGKSNHSWGRPRPITAGGAHAQSQPENFVGQIRELGASCRLWPTKFSSLVGQEACLLLDRARRALSSGARYSSEARRADPESGKTVPKFGRSGACFKAGGL
jgi:hypothetical protein